MQEFARDWSEREEGSCLNCVDSVDGCLCRRCKCTQCFWYGHLNEYEGFCELARQQKDARCPDCNWTLTFHKDDEFAKLHCRSGMHYFNNIRRPSM